MTVDQWIVILRRRYRERKILWTEECLQLAIDLEIERDRNHPSKESPIGLDPTEQTGRGAD